jgi:hypothetical protein
MSWEVLKKENIKFKILDKESKRIIIYNKNNQGKEIILKNSGYIGKLSGKGLNKQTQYTLFDKFNIKYPKTQYINNNINNINNINKIQIPYPLVAKPICGGRGHNVFFIDNKDTMMKKMNKYPNQFIVQERLNGNEFRVLIYKNTIISICKKNDSIIVGDGVNNLETLITKYNNHNKKLGFNSLKQHMYNDLNLEKIRKKGEIINLTKNKKCWAGSRWTTQDIKNVHKDNIDLFVNSLKAINYVYGGIDFMISDISKSYKEQQCGILEINSDPSMGIMDAANKISQYISCKNAYNMLFFDVILAWYHDV